LILFLDPERKTFRQPDGNWLPEAAVWITSYPITGLKLKNGIATLNITPVWITSYPITGLPSNPCYHWDMTPVSTLLSLSTWTVWNPYHHWATRSIV